MVLTRSSPRALFGQVGPLAHYAKEYWATAQAPEAEQPDRW